MEYQHSALDTARELATHASDIAHLQKDMDNMVADIRSIKEALISINNTLSEAKGGWKTLIVVGTIASAITSAVAWVINKFF